MQQGVNERAFKFTEHSVRYKSYNPVKRIKI